MANEAEDLRDAFQTMAETLAPVVAQLQMENSSDYSHMEAARKALVSAARELNTVALTTLFAGNDDLAKLKLLADEINAKADSIAVEERNVARIAGIGTGALSIVSAVEALDVAGVINAVKGVTAILD